MEVRTVNGRVQTIGRPAHERPKVVVHREINPLRATEKDFMLWFDAEHDSQSRSKGL